MPDDRCTYVIDTNVLVDYPDMIPGGEREPNEPTLDLNHAHLVIPTVVIRELSNFKKENSDRGKAAREVLRKLFQLFGKDIRSMEEVYNLRAPVETSDEGQKISILPVHKNFKNCLAFHPSDNDMDGQIILAAIAANLALNNLSIDGTLSPDVVKTMTFTDAVLLTNDNGLAIRARERGLRIERYGYETPEPYTGRRDIVVPLELFKEFYNGRKLERAIFEEMLPEEPKLVANEFIVMHLASLRDYPRDFDLLNNPYFLHTGRFDYDEDAIVPLKYVSNFPVRPKNEGQAIYAEALMDPNFAAVICTGPAGSGKTYMATIYGYVACKAGAFIGVTAVPCESRSRIGALPGDLDEKMDPDIQPLKNALRNYLLSADVKLKKELALMGKFGLEDMKGKKRGDCSNGDSDKRSIKVRLKDRVDLIWDNWFTSIPIDVARGRDFAYELAIYDEFQDQNVAQADTLIKRIGTNGKIILTGDIEQIHSPYLDRNNNGLVYATRQLFDNPMVAQVCFTENEVVRHPLVKLIASRQKVAKRKKNY